MSTVIKSGLDSTVATVDPTLKALYTTPKGVGVMKYDHDDFTIDSFERLRVSEPRIIFENSFGSVLTSTQTQIWESAAISSGTQALTTNLYGQEFNTLLTNGSGYWIQSYNHIRYAPGVSTVFRMSFNFNDLRTNVRMRLGMFTDQGTFPSTAGDGLYLEADGAAIAFVRRYMTTGGVGAEQRVLQADWNLNKMLGDGDVSDPTRNNITLDWTKSQHLVIEYQWLGVGTIRFGFETGSNGIVWAHEINSVNNLSAAWSRTGSLPVRVEIISTGVLASAGKLTVINCVVQQEGDIATRRGWRYFAATSGSAAKVGGTAIGLYPLMSLRGSASNDLTKRVKFVPTSISISVLVVGTVGVTPILVSLLMLPTLNTGATFAVTPAGSSVTVDNAATSTTLITGTPIWSTIVPNVVGTYTFDMSQLDDNNNVPGYNAAGTVAIGGPAVLALAAGPMVAAFTAAAQLTATINWKELV